MKEYITSFIKNKVVIIIVTILLGIYLASTFSEIAICNCTSSEKSDPTSPSSHHK